MLFAGTTTLYPTLSLEISRDPRLPPALNGATMNTIAPDWTELEEAFSRKDGERVMRFLAELEIDELFRIKKDSFLLLPYRTDEENRILQQVDICNLQQ